MEKPESSEERCRWFRSLVFSDVAKAMRKAKEESTLLSVRDGSGETVFHYVVIENRIDLAEQLLMAGANVNAQDDGQYTPLMGAAFLGHLEMVKWLISKGADINLKDDCGETALSKVARNDRQELFDFLVSLVDKDINFYFNDLTAHDILTSQNNKDLVMREKLLSLGLSKRYD